MRPCTALKPCDWLTKYAGVLDEQPMPLIFASMCGSMPISNTAWMIAAVTESWPQPAHSVEITPS